MDITPLPFSASLKQYETQAKDLVKAYRSGDPEAMRCFRRYHPRLRGRADTNDRNDVTDSEIRSARLTLADAQSVVARRYCFESWRKLMKYVAALTRKDSVVLQFESAVEAIISGDVITLESSLRENPASVRARSTREHHATLLHYVGANGVDGFRQKGQTLGPARCPRGWRLEALWRHGYVTTCQGRTPDLEWGGRCPRSSIG